MSAISDFVDNLCLNTIIIDNFVMPRTQSVTPGSNFRHLTECRDLKVILIMRNN